MRSERPPAGPEKYKKVLKTICLSKKQHFSHLANIYFFYNFTPHEAMTPRLVHTKLRRSAFVLQFDTTNRNPHARKQLKKYGWTKSIHGSPEIRNWTPRSPNNVFNHDFGKSPWWRYSSSARPLYQSYHYHMGDASAQRMAPGKAGRIYEGARKRYV